VTDRSEQAGAESIAPFYADWSRYNRRIVEGLRGLSDDDLALRAGNEHWPIWAIAGHTAGARVYWLCHVFGEPGAETTPFTDPSGFGWEDDLDTTRSAAELAEAFESSWEVVADCLERWTPAMLGESFERERGGRIQYHTRQSVLLRLITHDAYHAGEIALILGSHGRPALDLWPPAASDPARSPELP
jgi:uncharacterized damage-inducible protein DinB